MQQKSRLKNQTAKFDKPQCLPYIGLTAMQRCPSAFIIITVPRFVKIGIYKKQMFDKPQCLSYNRQAGPETNGRARPEGSTVA